MNYSNKKAQGAIEYLLIIGSAILVVAVVIIALVGLGAPATEGVSEEKENLQNLKTEEYPWFFEELSKFSETGISYHIENIPEKNLRYGLEQQGVKTLLIVPISNNTMPMGFLGIDMTKKKRVWSQHEINLLMIIGRAIGTTLYPPKGD